MQISTDISGEQQQPAGIEKIARGAEGRSEIRRQIEGIMGKSDVGSEGERRCGVLEAGKVEGSAGDVPVAAIAPRTRDAARVEIEAAIGIAA